MTLADFTSLHLIIPRLGGRDVPGVLKELTLALQQEDRVPDVLPFYHAVLNREYLATTNAANGLAFPHARLPGVKDISFAFGRTERPIAWHAGGGETVKMVFLIAVPATESTLYLRLVAGFAGLSKNPSLFDQLRHEESPHGILEVFRQVRLKHEPALRSS